MQSVRRILALGLAERFGLPVCHTFGFFIYHACSRLPSLRSWLFALSYCRLALVLVHGLHAIMMPETTIAVDDRCG